MTLAEKKLLCLLEKIRAEWDLIPKKSKAHYSVSSDYSWPEKRFRMRITPRRLWKWKQECEIEDHTQLENMLRILQEEGLIYKFEFMDENR